MIDIKFNNYSLSNEEISHIISFFEKDIHKNSTIYGKLDEDCEQEIRIQIYKSLSRNNKK